jgi:hypothetical protein
LRQSRCAPHQPPRIPGRFTESRAARTSAFSGPRSYTTPGDATREAVKPGHHSTAVRRDGSQTVRARSRSRNASRRHTSSSRSRR